MLMGLAPTTEGRRGSQRRLVEGGRYLGIPRNRGCAAPREGSERVDDHPLSLAHCPGNRVRYKRFVILERGTAVCDNTSGLVWERRRPDQSPRTYQDAVAWCAAKGQAWQLPGIKDFMRILRCPAGTP